MSNNKKNETNKVIAIAPAPEAIAPLTVAEQLALAISAIDEMKGKVPDSILVSMRANAKTAILSDENTRKVARLQELADERTAILNWQAENGFRNTAVKVDGERTRNESKCEDPAKLGEHTRHTKSFAACPLAPKVAAAATVAAQ